jgi:hypothetical protein
MCPRFLNIEPKVISFPGPRLVMGQSAPCHFGVKCNGSFFKQVSAISGNVQELIVAHAFVSFIEAFFQDQPAVFQLPRKRLAADCFLLLADAAHGLYFGDVIGGEGDFAGGFADVDLDGTDFLGGGFGLL